MASTRPMLIRLSAITASPTQRFMPSPHLASLHHVVLLRDRDQAAVQGVDDLRSDRAAPAPHRLRVGYAAAADEGEVADLSSPICDCCSL